MEKEHNNTFQMIADYEGDIRNLFEMAPSGEIPILATRNMVLFPGVIAPILVGRPASYHLVRRFQDKSDTIIAIFCQKDPTVDTPSAGDLYEYGVYAKIIRVLEMPGPSNNLTAIVQGLGKCRLTDITKYRPYLTGITESITEILPPDDDTEFNAAVEDLRVTSIDYIKKNEEIPDESQFALTNITNSVVMVSRTSARVPARISTSSSANTSCSSKSRTSRKNSATARARPSAWNCCARHGRRNGTRTWRTCSTKNSTNSTPSTHRVLTTASKSTTCRRW